MYSKESLKKYINNVKTEMEKFRNEKKLKLSFSTGNRKIGKVLNISTAPVITCKNCSGCKHFCYDIKACLQYPGTLKARAKNTVILEKDRADFFNQINEKMSRRRTNKYFRFHVAGEIIDLDYFSRMVEVARMHPDFIIWTYTKMYWIVNQYVKEHGNDRKKAIPKNLSIMFSEWKGTKIINPYHFPEFRVVFEDEKRPAGFYCPGNCDVCKASYRGCIAQETTYCMIH